MNKKLISKIILFFIFLFSFSFANAELKTEKISSDNINFSWLTIENVFIYKIYYGLDSIKTVPYDKESDYIEKNSYTIYDLTPETKYYFTLFGYDDTGKEIYKSNEYSFSTVSKKIIDYGTLYIEDAVQVGKRKVELIFSNEISDISNYDREFKIENIKNKNEILDVTDTSIGVYDKKSLLITLDKEPTIGQEYKIIVLNIRDIYDQNIEFGVNSEATFKGIEITEEQELDFNSAKEYLSLNNGTTNTNLLDNSNTNGNNNNTNTETKVNEIVSIKGESGNLAGVDLNSAGVDPNVLTEATDASKLPATGPESILVLLLAIIFSGIFFAYRFKKV